ncbi:MAG: hypothetical protein WBB67_05675 [bacterium]
MLTLILLLTANIGFEHLLVDPIAHRVGMGYAQFGDGYSVSYNPAGLAYNYGSFYSTSYLSYIGDTHFGYLGYEKNQLGLGIKYFYGGQIKKTDEWGAEHGSFGVHFIDLNVGKGFFYRNVAIGVSIKAVYAKIDTLYSLGAGIDLGTMYLWEEPDVQVGFAVKNIGSGVKPFIETSEMFPYEVNVGGVKRFTDAWLGLDIVKPALMDFGIRIGGGYSVVPNLELKASYNTLLSSIRTESSGLEFLAGLTAGFSLRTKALCIDYTYSPYFDLGGCHRLSVSLGG